MCDLPIFVIEGTIVLVLLDHFQGVSDCPVVKIFKHPVGETNQESNEKVPTNKENQFASHKNELYLEALRPPER